VFVCNRHKVSKLEVCCYLITAYVLSGLINDKFTNFVNIGGTITLALSSKLVDTKQVFGNYMLLI